MEQADAEAAIRATIKQYPHNDSAFFLQEGEMADVVFTSMRSLPHGTL